MLNRFAHRAPHEGDELVLGRQFRHLPKRRRLAVSWSGPWRNGKEHALVPFWRADRRHCLALRPRAHHERLGRLGLVLVNRVCRRLLDRFRREGGSVRSCLCRLDLAFLGECKLGAAVCVEAGGSVCNS